jgi:hypothetical protein
MKRYAAKPTTYVPQPKATVAVPLDEPTVAFDVQKLLEKGGLILQREIQNLLTESAGGKLQPTSARDLVQYVKLLAELRSEQAAVLHDMADEELSKIVPK